MRSKSKWGVSFSYPHHPLSLDNPFRQEERSPVLLPKLSRLRGDRNARKKLVI